MKKIYILSYASYYQDGGEVHIETFAYNTREEAEEHAREHLLLTCVEDLYMNVDEDKDEIKDEIKKLIEDGEWSKENEDYTEAYGYKITEIEI